MSLLERELSNDSRAEQRRVNEALVRRVFEEVLSSGKLHVIDDVFASDYVGYVDRPLTVQRGSDLFRNRVVKARNVFFGLDVEIDHLSASEDTVLVHWTATGRHEQEFMGLDPVCIIGEAGTEPGGAEVTATGRTLCLLSDDQVQQSWTTWEMASFLDQFEDQSGEFSVCTDARLPVEMAELYDDISTDRIKDAPARPALPVEHGQTTFAALHYRKEAESMPFAGEMDEDQNNREGRIDE